MRNRKPYIQKPAQSNECFESSLTDLRFRSLLGKQNWNALPAAVQKRFSKRLNIGYCAVYKGYIQHTKISRAGKILGQALRLIGAPLPLDDDNENQAAIVTVTEDKQGGGQFWTRQYGRRNGFPQVFHSTKQFRGPTGLYEHIGFGLGMSLRLEVKDEALIFRSDRYYLGAGKRRLALPKWMTPGQLTVGHADHGDGWFEFTLKLDHPWFGRLIDQCGMFCDESGF